MRRRKIEAKQYLDAVDALLISARKDLESAIMGLDAASEIDDNAVVTESSDDIREVIERLDAIGVRVKRATR